jgi:hypothetical protein
LLSYSLQFPEVNKGTFVVIYIIATLHHGLRIGSKTRTPLFPKFSTHEFIASPALIILSTHLIRRINVVKHDLTRRSERCTVEDLVRERRKIDCR